MLGFSIDVLGATSVEEPVLVLGHRQVTATETRGQCRTFMPLV
jgi:hypothetical protein